METSETAQEKISSSKIKIEKRMDERDIKKVREIIKDCFDEKFAEFYIGRERHYREHEWLKSLIDWVESIKSTAIKTAVRMLVLSFFGMLGVAYALFRSGKAP